MRKLKSIIFFASLGVTFIYAQSISFTFLKGASNSPNNGPSYPTSKGVFGLTYSPGGRDGHKVIVYNGLGYTFHGLPTSSNDVWMFDPAPGVNSWAWVAGYPDSETANYGTINSPSAGNTPGFRYNFGGALHEARAEFILYGGYSNLNANDLWTFSFATNSWTWFAGLSDAGEEPNYGTLGSSSASTTPGGRAAPACAIYEPTGEFILFAGISIDYRSDTWSFDFATSKWTWISGPSSTTANGVVGPKIQWSTSYNPDRRYHAGYVFSSRNNYIYMFGGTRGIRNYFNDIWAFNRRSLEWTWLHGVSNFESFATYGTLGTSRAINSPGGRGYFSISLHDTTSLILVHAGTGRDNTGAYGNLADFWAFNTVTNEWTWIGGSSISFAKPIYTGSNAFPGEQNYGSMAIDQATGNIMMFGGEGPVSSSYAAGPLDQVWREYLSVSVAPIYSSQSSLPSSSSSLNFTESISSISLLSSKSLSMSRSHILSLNSDVTLISKSASSFQFRSTSKSNSITTKVLSSVFFPNSITTQSWSSINSPQSSGGASTPASDFVLTRFSPDSPGNTPQVAETSARYSLDSQLTILSSTSTSPSPVYSATRLEQRISEPSSLTLPSQSPIIRQSLKSIAPSNPSFLSSEVNKALLRYCILGSLLILAVTIIAFTLKYIRNLSHEKYVTRSQTISSLSTTTGSTMGDTGSLTNKTNTLSSTNYSKGQSTVGSVTTGIYLPGGLQVQGSTAYRVEKEIARGGGGSVWTATAFVTELSKFGSKVIVKIPNYQIVTERQLSLFHQEIALMNAFKSHKNIVQLMGYSEDPYAIILKYYPRGSLAKWMEGGQRTMRQLIAFVKDISLGLFALHSGGIVHCDLKPDNVLIDSSARLLRVLTDFGIAKIVTAKLLKVDAYQVQRIRGFSVTYAAPEVLREFRGVSSSLSPAEQMARDIFALAMIIYGTQNGSDKWRVEKTF